MLSVPNQTKLKRARMQRIFFALIAVFAIYTFAYHNLSYGNAQPSYDLKQKNILHYTESSTRLIKSYTTGRHSDAHTSPRKPVTLSHLAEKVPDSQKSNSTSRNITIKVDKPKIMITTTRDYLCGDTRLGNKLYMVAATYAAAVKYNYQFVLLKDQRCIWIYVLKDLFTTFNTSVTYLPYSQIRLWRRVEEGPVNEYVPIQPQTINFSVSGYRQSWKHFQSEAEQDGVRRLFRLNTKYEIKANRLLHSARAKFSAGKDAIFIGVHMRLGDLLKPHRVKHGRRTANATFYQSAFKAASLHFQTDVIFVVATDSVDIGRTILGDLQTTHNVFWANGTAEEDFAALTKCNHSIISGGSFSFWVGWLAGGETWYFADLARPDSKFYLHHHPKEFFLPSWKPVHIY
ncbi:FUT1 [Bugula neritina]|uniref:L-Fucosyltransferase n=1 Tax=Bugula neritina TaxID=10212 RepID=A0A7J7KTL5_BUGNE|nr:FUT1 [Bugula neritina]